ncbi:hypothetical protein ACIA32_08825 [Lactobacillus delbrueckii subsp. bulgaricus]
MDKIKGREYKLPKRYEHYFKLTYHQDKFYGYEEREDVIERELQLCGYFAIVTSEKMTASEALNLYKSRDISEKLFGCCQNSDLNAARLPIPPSGHLVPQHIFNNSKNLVKWKC